LSITTTRYCFAYGFYNIAGLKGQTDILVSFIKPLLIILRASPLCRIARHVRRTQQISGLRQQVRCISWLAGGFEHFSSRSLIIESRSGISFGSTS
jgi:hypothetical protein